MPTNIDLSEQELAELKAYTKETDDTAAVRSAMTEYLRLARRLQLKALSGQVEMQENWPVLEDAELRDQSGGSGTRAH
jgi:hypothetical protein